MGSKGYKLTVIFFCVVIKNINFYKKFILQTKTLNDSGIILSAELDEPNNEKVTHIYQKLRIEVSTDIGGVAALLFFVFCFW